MGIEEEPPERSQPEGWNPELAETALEDFAIIGMDPERRIIHWNKGAELIFGYREPEVRGQPLAIIFTPQAVREIAGPWRGGVYREAVYVRAPGGNGSPGAGKLKFGMLK